MAITVKHKFVSAIPDAGDPTIVQPSNWNDDHQLTGTVPVTNGGTGASTANDGFNALAPSQTGNSGKYLTTDGTNSSWATNPLGTVTSVAATAGTGIAVTGSPITTSGTLNITNTAPDQTVVLNAGTGISTSGTYPNFTITNTSPSSGGTVTSVASGTGLTGGPITTTGTLSIANTGVTAGTYGSAAVIPVIAVNNQGQITSISTQPTNAPAYQGTWNASTNSPLLVSSVGTAGYYYVVSVAGNTTLNGVSGWAVGDWAIFENGVWQKIAGSSSESFTNLTTTNLAVTGLTGYMYANNTGGNVTASTTIPNTAISGLGTMSTQNANAVAVTGGTINGTTIGATTASSGAFTVLSTSSTTSTTPTLSFNGSNSNMASGAIVSGSYLQNLLQNKSGTANASTNYVLSNDLGTDSTYYGEFGMNSSVYSSGTPTDFFSLNNGVYFSGHDGDVTVGSGNGYKTYFAWGTSGQSAHVINASGAIGLNTSITGSTNFGTSGQVLTSAGSGATPTWTTPTTGTVTSVSGTTGRITSTGGTTPVIDLASGVATAGTTGSSTLIPVVTIDTYGRVTSITTASNPQGTVTSVAALTLDTTGTDLSSTVATGTTTPVITLQVPTASASNRGALSSADWTTFNGKQAALVSGTNIKTVNGTTLLGSGDLGTITYAYGGTGQTTVTTGDLLYGSATNVWSKLGIGSTGQILRVVSGAPAWGTDYTGTVTSVSGTGTVSGISLSGTVTSSGSLTLGGTLDLSSPPAIGGTAANTITGTTITATKFVGVSGGTF